MRTTSLVSNRKLRRKIREILLFLLALVIACYFLFPFLWMVSTSLKTLGQTFTYPPEWIPRPVRLENYWEAWQEYAPFNLYLKNTVVITGLAVIGTVLSSSLVAFSFGRLRWPGRDGLFLILLSTMMLPYQVTLIPQFVLYTKLDWVDTYLPLIVPTFFGNPFCIFLLRQFIMSVPLELDEAARIDGCSNFMIYYKIILPLCKPALASAAVFTFMANWNDFMAPLIYLRTESKFTLQLGMLIFRSQSEVYWNHLMAVSVLALAPCLVIFFLVQRWFIEGIALTGIKG